MKEPGRLRRLDEGEPGESSPTAPSPPAVREPPPEPSGTPPEDRAPEPEPPGPQREPLDLEGSIRDLETRQAAWFTFREEWIRRKARRAPGEPATPESSAGRVEDPTPDRA